MGHGNSYKGMKYLDYLIQDKSEVDAHYLMDELIEAGKGKKLEVRAIQNHLNHRGYRCVGRGLYRKTDPQALDV